MFIEAAIPLGQVMEVDLGRDRREERCVRQVGDSSQSQLSEDKEDEPW